ncbi:hypothetical protein Tco_0835951 [Tanacetum coccineum]
MYHNVNQLQWQLERENLHSCDPKTCLDLLKTQFKEFFDSKEVDELEKHIDERVLKYRELRMKEREANLSTDGRTLDASSVTEGTTLEACLVTKGIEINDSLAAKESLDDSVTSSEHLNESNSLRN